MEQEISFSALLRRIRKAYHYNCTQAEIAEKFGYSEETIRSWELGRRFPAHHEIARLAQLMELDLQEVQDAIQVGHVHLQVNSVLKKKSLANRDLTAVNSPLFLESTQESDAMNKQRRELLRLLSTTGVALALPQDEFANADILKRLAKALKKPNRVDQTTRSCTGEPAGFPKPGRPNVSST